MHTDFNLQHIFKISDSKSVERFQQRFQRGCMRFQGVVDPLVSPVGILNALISWLASRRVKKSKKNHGLSAGGGYSRKLVADQEKPFTSH